MLEVMKINNTKFYRFLMNAISLPIVLIVLVTILYFIVMNITDHKVFRFGYFILFFALIKSFLITMLTFKKLAKLVKNCYSFDRLLIVFILIITITIFSFAIDYSCLFEYDEFTFEGIHKSSSSYINNLPNFIYFSVTTFATVGYGDIIPVSGIARILVILEIFLSFLIIVFALTNINKIHIHEK